jgi:hypothetical protein
MSMNVLLFGINLIVAYFVWDLIWKRTAIDHYRDKLFDLRDEVREHFLKHELALDGDVYRGLRDLLNAHIRYIEQLTFRRYVATTVAMHTHPELAQRLRDDVAKKTETDNAELASYVADVRQRSIQIMLGYMGETSLFFLISYPIGLLLVIALMLWRLIKNARAKIGFSTLFKIATVTGMAVAMPARAGLIDSQFDGTLVEEYSYQASLR